MDWTPQTSPFDGGHASRGCWVSSLGLFAVVGHGPSDAVITSPDGLAWTGRGNPFGTGSGNDIVWATTLGILVAVGTGADFVCTSPDAIAWTGRGNPLANELLTVAWSEAQAVLAVGCSVSGPTDHVLATSPDGTTWTPVSTPFDGGAISGIAYSPTLNLWVAVGHNHALTRAVMTSPDLSAWTVISTPFDSGSGGGVIWAPSRAAFYATNVSASTPGVIASADGAIWSSQGTPFDADSGIEYCVFAGNGALFLGGHDGVVPFQIARSDTGVAWVEDDVPNPFDGGHCSGFAYSPDVTLAFGQGAGAVTEAVMVGSVPPRPAELPPPQALKNTWRWVVCGLDWSIKSFLDKLATNVQVAYVLDDAARMTCDLPSDDTEIYQTANDGSPRVSFGNRVIFGLRREEPAEGAPWVCRFAGVISMLQDQATEDEPITHLTAYDPWMWAKSLPVLNPDGSLLGQNGLTYTGHTGAYIAKDLIANAYAWIVATFPDPMPWSEQGDGVYLPNDGQHNFIDIDTGHYDTTEIIPTINFPQGISVGEAWTQLCQTGTVDIILKPVFDQPGNLCILNVYAQAGKTRPNAVFGWDVFPRNLVGVDHLLDGTLIENIAQFYAGNVAAAQQQSTASVNKYGPYFVQRNYPSGANPASVSLVALAEVALRKAGKKTLQIDPTPGLAPDPFTEYFLGDVVPVWAGRPMPSAPPLNGLAHGNALRGGIRSYSLGTNRVYGFELDLSDDLQETVRSLLLTDPNVSVF